MKKTFAKKKIVISIIITIFVIFLLFIVAMLVIKFDKKVSLFGMDSGKKWSLLGNHFDKSLLRIVVGFDLAAAMEIPYASQVRLCKVFLDGRYMGIYTAIEPLLAK